MDRVSGKETYSSANNGIYTIIVVQVDGFYGAQQGRVRVSEEAAAAQYDMCEITHTRHVQNAKYARRPTHRCAGSYA